jgi:hypothetical protein
MEMLEGLDDRALALDGANLQILRWGAEQNRIPLVSLEPSTIERDDKKTYIWLPLERQAEAEAFAAKVDQAAATE